MPEGDALETEASQSALSPKSSLTEFGEPSFIARFGAMPDTSFPDDYRCFQVGDVFTEDTFVKPLDHPDATDIVHCFAIRYQPADVAAPSRRMR